MEKFIHDIQELAELQKEITKYLMGRYRPTKMIEEIADVYISLDHLIKTLDLDSGLIQERINSIMGIVLDKCCKCGCNISNNPIIIKGEKYCYDCALKKLREDQEAK